jgi:hypothetical protein
MPALSSKLQWLKFNFMWLASWIAFVLLLCMTVGHALCSSSDGFMQRLLNTIQKCALTPSGECGPSNRVNLMLEGNKSTCSRAASQQIGAWKKQLKLSFKDVLQPATGMSPG